MSGKRTWNLKGGRLARQLKTDLLGHAWCAFVTSSGRLDRLQMIAVQGCTSQFNWPSIRQSEGLKMLNIEDHFGSGHTQRRRRRRCITYVLHI